MTVTPSQCTDDQLLEAISFGCRFVELEPIVLSLTMDMLSIPSAAIEGHRSVSMFINALVVKK
jgi:hypothetical protein